MVKLTSTQLLELNDNGFNPLPLPVIRVTASTTEFLRLTEILIQQRSQNSGLVPSAAMITLIFQHLFS